MAEEAFEKESEHGGWREGGREKGEGGRTVVRLFVRLEVHLLFERAVAARVLADEGVRPRRRVNSGDVGTEKVMLSEGFVAIRALRGEYGQLQRHRPDEGERAHVVSLAPVHDLYMLFEVLIRPKLLVAPVLDTRVLFLPLPGVSAHVSLEVRVTREGRGAGGTVEGAL